MSAAADIDILEITDEISFGRLPPCADPRFDHRSCDYWEDGNRGAKSSRPRWWQPAPSTEHRPEPAPPSENPFAVAPKSADEFNPFSATGGGSDEAAFNPFAPEPPTDAGSRLRGPRKLGLLNRGRDVFGSYAKVLLSGGEPAVYAQFGPLSAYPRAQQIRELYPRLPQAPLPAVITCIATAATARGQGLASKLVAAVADDLAGRGFSAIETYPDLTLGPDEASAADPRFWEACGFAVAAADERYPVLRRELS